MSKKSASTAQIQSDTETGIVLAGSANAEEVQARHHELLDGKAIDQATSDLGKFEERLTHLSNMSTIFDDDEDAGPISMGGGTSAVVPEAPAAPLPAADDADLDAEEDAVVIGGLADEDGDDDLLGDVFPEGDDLMAPFADDAISGAQDTAYAEPDFQEFTIPGDDELQQNSAASDTALAHADAEDEAMDDLSYLHDELDGSDALDDLSGEYEAEAEPAAQDGSTEEEPAPRHDVLNVATTEMSEAEDQSLSSLIGVQPAAEIVSGDEMQSEADPAENWIDDLDDALPEAEDGAVDIDELDAALSDAIQDTGAAPAETEVTGSDDDWLSMDDMPRPDWADTADGTSVPGSAWQDDASTSESAVSTLADDGDDLQPWSVDPDEGSSGDTPVKDVDFSDVEVFTEPEQTDYASYETPVDDYRDGYQDDAAEAVAAPAVEEGPSGVSEKENSTSGIMDDMEPDAARSEAVDDSWFDVGTPDTAGETTPAQVPSAADAGQQDAPAPAAEPKSKRGLLMFAAGAVALVIAASGGYLALNKLSAPAASSATQAQLPAPQPVQVQAEQTILPAGTAVPAEDAQSEGGTSQTDDQENAAAADTGTPDPVTLPEAELPVDNGDLSELMLEEIAAPGAIEGEQAPASEAASNLNDLTEDLASAAEGDLDALFLDLPSEEAEPAPAAPVLNEEVLADYAKKDEIAEVRNAIDLMFETVETLSAEVVERDAAIVSLQEQLALAEAKAQRAETLALGQNEVLAEFLRVKEKVDMAENLIVDLSRRTAAMETADPADRVAVERSITDLNERLEGMARDLGLIARVAINGSTAKSGAATAAAAGVPGSDSVYVKSPGGIPAPGTKAHVPSDVKVGDFVEGYGYVLQIMPTSEGGKVVVMENKSVLIPG